MRRLHRKRREIFPCAFCLPVKVKQNERFYFAPLSPIRKDEKNYRISVTQRNFCCLYR